uniref:Transposase n=1 Tax=Heterorhabditis bacteriophora TaxID=37862 RepID=A0A1I7X690_HETBA
MKDSEPCYIGNNNAILGPNQYSDLVVNPSSMIAVVEAMQIIPRVTLRDIYTGFGWFEIVNLMNVYPVIAKVSDREYTHETRDSIHVKTVENSVVIYPMERKTSSSHYD